MCGVPSRRDGGAVATTWRCSRPGQSTWDGDEESTADDRQAEVRGAFDAAAADSTALGRHLCEPIGTAAVKIADPQLGDASSTPAVGTGTSVVPAARLVGQAGLVDAGDLSRPMIDELRRSSSRA
ncbi:hypothetical protein AB0M48_29785 [Lentzea sp. NPDC051208]|uniref:hypothetical protein n=1 Tax=Lentzea sp. NPDC051208 TaxID=3154642 RepID=UPI00341E8927